MARPGRLGASGLEPGAERGLLQDAPGHVRCKELRDLGRREAGAAPARWSRRREARAPLPSRGGGGSSASRTGAPACLSCVSSVF
jgi:hypothetical protein